MPEEKPVRQAYRHSNQGILVSCQICLVHAMAEGKDGGGNHYCYYGMKLESLNCHWMGYDSIPIKMFLLILVLLLLLVLVVLVPPGEAVE